jgi:hypothetical protein
MQLPLLPAYVDGPAEAVEFCRHRRFERFRISGPDDLAGSAHQGGAIQKPIRVMPDGPTPGSLDRAGRDPQRLTTALVLTTVAALVACTPESKSDRPLEEPLPRPAIDWAPRSYVARRAADPIRVDGTLDEAAWRLAPWTEAFPDIEGPSWPAPPLLTRAKVLWNDEALWIGAELGNRTSGAL